MGWFGVVRGNSRSWAMPPFNWAHTTSYSTLVETMCLSFTVFTARCYASAVLAMGLCLCLSVCHKSIGANTNDLQRRWRSFTNCNFKWHFSYSLAVVDKISTNLVCARGPSAVAELLVLEHEQTDRQTDRQVQQNALSTLGQVYTANMRNWASKPVK